MITPFYYTKETREFSIDPRYNPHAMAVDRIQGKIDKAQEKIDKAELRVKDRSYLKSKLNNISGLALGTRTRNWIHGTGFTGDVRANKLARLEANKARLEARKEFHEKKLNKQSPSTSNELSEE